MNKRKKLVQIEDIHYSFYQPQILKTRLYDKSLFNRRYCPPTNRETEKTISNRGYSLCQPQILKTRLYDKHFFDRRYWVGWSTNCYWCWPKWFSNKIHYILVWTLPGPQLRRVQKYLQHPGCSTVLSLWIKFIAYLKRIFLRAQTSFK